MIVAFTVLLIASVAAGAVFMLSRRPPRPEPARASAPKLPSGFGDPARCAELTKSYKAALDEVNHCESDNECAVELRGEIWFGLDGCARFKGSALSFAKPDAIAKQWAEGGCAKDYELCSRAPEVMCRKGRCLEKPPSPLPDTWIRYDVARAFSFYLPPEMVKEDVRGEDSIVRQWKSDRISLGLDYGAWSNSLEIFEEERPFVLEERRIEIDGKKAKLVVLRNPQGPGFQAAVHFPEVPGCPPGMCLQSGPTKLTVWAACEERSDCDAAIMAYRSIVFWEK